MADFSKIKDKKKNRFGSPISSKESSTILNAPEHAPVNPKEEGREVKKKKARGKTGRTTPFSTRVSEEFDKDFRKVAFTMGLKKVDLLEECLKSYKKVNKI